MVQGALLGQYLGWFPGSWGFNLHDFITALLPLAHVKEKLPQSFHPALQGSPTLSLKGVCHFVLPILVTDAQGEGPACSLVQLPCPDSSLLQKERVCFQLHLGNRSQQGLTVGLAVLPRKEELVGLSPSPLLCLVLTSVGRNGRKGLGLQQWSSDWERGTGWGTPGGRHER